MIITGSKTITSLHLLLYQITQKKATDYINLTADTDGAQPGIKQIISRCDKEMYRKKIKEKKVMNL